MIDARNMSIEDIRKYEASEDYVPLYENGKTVAFEFIGKPDNKVYDEMLAVAKVRNDKIRSQPTKELPDNDAENDDDSDCGLPN